MSRRVTKKEVNATECHVCKKSGESWQICSSHNFRDTKGRIACERFLKKIRENLCNKCNTHGHFSDRCTGKSEFKVNVKVFKHIGITCVEKPSAPTKGSFSAISGYESEEEPAMVCPVATKPKKNIRTDNWADWTDDDE